MSKLDILIPQYCETEDVIRPLLDSIEGQTPKSVLAEIQVIIANDGSEVILSDTFLSQYSFKILYLKEPHAGVSATRNKLLDAATADYIMYCDADDSFFRLDALSIILEHIDTEDFEFLRAAFFEEKLNPRTNKLGLLLHADSLVFVHGKVYKRQFLIDQNIRWAEALTMHEDRFFNCLVDLLATKSILEPRALYTWKYRPGSVVRKYTNFVYQTYEHQLAAEIMLLNECLTRGLPDQALFQLNLTLLQSYFIMTSTTWALDRGRTRKALIQQQVRQLYTQFKPVILKSAAIRQHVQPEVKLGISKIVALNDQAIQATPFEAWLSNLEQQKGVQPNEWFKIFSSHN